MLRDFSSLVFLHTSPGLECLPGEEYTEESLLHDGEYSRELITNTNPRIFGKSEILLCMSNGTRRSCLMKKLE